MQSLSSNSYSIDRDRLYELYMQWVNDVCEACDWKTSFGPEEIVGSICNILEKNPGLFQEKEEEKVF